MTSRGPRVPFRLFEGSTFRSPKVPALPCSDRRNGAGKSSALKLIAGLLSPVAGEILLNGEGIKHLSPEQRVRRGIVLVPEGRGVFPALSVKENLKVGAYWHRPRQVPLKDLIDDVYSVLPALADRRKQAAGTLSGGEQQMVALGRALMADPKVLLLDEPSLGLAPKVVQNVYDVLMQFSQRGISIVLVEQYAGLALGLCDAVVGLNKGRVVVAGPAVEIAADTHLLKMYMGTDVKAAAEVITTRR